MEHQSPGYTYVRTPGPVMVPRMAEVVALAFGSTSEDCAEWIQRSGNGLSDWRAMAAGSRVDACLRFIPMGQYYGGKSVPMVGVAGVAVSPEARGQGLGRRMMNEAMSELAASGAVLSALYASTQSLYRQVGFEQAGYRCEITIPIEHIDVRERTPEGTGTGKRRWVQVNVGERERLYGCAAAFAEQFNGLLDRSGYCWERVWAWRDRTAQVFALVDEQDEVQAYVAAAQTRLTDRTHQLEIADLAYRDAGGARAVLGFIHDYASMVRAVKFLGPPVHPLQALLGAQRFTCEHREIWMLRLVDAAAAIAARGYSPAVRGDVVLEIADPLLKHNDGGFRLAVQDGVGRLERTNGQGTKAAAVSMTINTLATLYSGLRSARELAGLGLICGPAREVDLLGVLMPMAMPWTPDFF